MGVEVASAQCAFLSAVNTCNRMINMPKTKKWVQNVKTASTYPPEGIFTKDAETIARVMGSKEVSPKGTSSAVRMIQFYINRAGKNLPASRKEELEKAKEILREKLKSEKETKTAISQAAAVKA